jgi:hypothetical protein
MIYAFDIHGTYQREANPLMWNRFLNYANPGDYVNVANAVSEILQKEFNGEIVSDWITRKSAKFGRAAYRPYSYVRFKTDKDFIYFKLRFDGL